MEYLDESIKLVGAPSEADLRATENSARFVWNIMANLHNYRCRSVNDKQLKETLPRIENLAKNLVETYFELPITLYVCQQS